MIAKISGKVVEKGVNYLLIDVGGITYQVFLPVTVMQRLDTNLTSQDNVGLITYHYLHSEPSRSTPVLIGFLNEIEKEFFEIFITVSGIGPRAALKALNQPISLIAKAIDEGDVNFLKSLPGIGQQRAKEIVAKLQNKVAKFGLIQDAKSHVVTHVTKDFEEESMAVLMQLGYKKPEAVVMIRKALEGKSGINSTEDMLNEVYKQRKIK